MITAVVAPLNSPGFYEITLTDRNGCLVVVSRTLQSLKELDEKLSATNYLPSDVEPQFPQNDNPEVLQLQTYLNSWLNYYTESQDVTDALTDFMEDSPGPSVVSQLQFNVLKEKVKSCDCQVKRIAFPNDVPLIMIPTDRTVDRNESSVRNCPELHGFEILSALRHGDHVADETGRQLELQLRRGLPCSHGQVPI